MKDIGIDRDDRTALAAWASLYGVTVLPDSLADDGDPLLYALGWKEAFAYHRAHPEVAKAPPLAPRDLALRGAVVTAYASDRDLADSALRHNRVSPLGSIVLSKDAPVPEGGPDAAVVEILRVVSGSMKALTQVDRTPAYAEGEARPDGEVPASHGAKRWRTPREIALDVLALVSRLGV